MDTIKIEEGDTQSKDYRDSVGDGPYMVVGFDMTTDPCSIVEYEIGDEEKWERSGYTFIGNDLFKNNIRVGHVERNWILVNFDKF